MDTMKEKYAELEVALTSVEAKYSDMKRIYDSVKVKLVASEDEIKLLHSSKTSLVSV